MKKTIKMAALRQPNNYWINRRVYADDTGKEYVKINGRWFGVDWLMLKGWKVDIAF